MSADPSGRVVDPWPYQAKVKAAERLDGQFVVPSNDDTLSAEDRALGYQQLQRVEEAWHMLKSGLRLRPIFHWAVHRIPAHVALSMLALLFYFSGGGPASPSQSLQRLHCHKSTGQTAFQKLSTGKL